MSNPISQYRFVSVAYPFRIRGTNQQTDNGLGPGPTGSATPGFGLLNPTLQSFGTGIGSTAPIRMRGVSIGYFNLVNKTGAAMNVGLGGRVPNDIWQAGSWTDATTTYTKQSNLQSTTAQAIETTTVNDGFVVLSLAPFNAITMNITTASVGVGVARTLEYSNQAGTGWTTYTQAGITKFDGGAANWALGEQIIVFDEPVNWGPSAGGGALGTNIPDGFFAIRVRSTTAPTTAGQASGLELCALPFVLTSLAANATHTMQPSPGEFSIIYVDAVVAYFDTASYANSLDALIRFGDA